MKEAARPGKVQRGPSSVAAVPIVAVVYLAGIPFKWILTRLGLFNRFFIFVLEKLTGADVSSKAFANYMPASHDVLVCTYSKSGTNWMLQIATQIVFRGEAEFGHIHDIVPWPDIGINHSIPLDDTTMLQKSPVHRRVIKTHLAARHVPYNEQARYLVVVRDPKEVFVSSYYFSRNIVGPMMPSVAEWLELFLSRHFPIGFGASWAEHTAGYWALRDRPNVLLLHYQDMKRDLAGSVRRVAEMMGVVLTPEEMARVVEKSGFAYMSGIDHKFNPFPDSKLPWNRQLRMIRKGEAGASAELLAPQQQAHIDHYCMQELQRLGSDFPYTRCYPSTAT